MAGLDIEAHAAARYLPPPHLLDGYQQIADRQ
jgi:hypothetical protein